MPKGVPRWGCLPSRHGPSRAGCSPPVGTSPFSHAISLAHQACELLPEAEVIPPVGTLVTTIRAYLVSGDVTAATEHEFATAVALIRPSDNPFGAVSSIGLLARLHVLQGRLRQAAATYAQVEQAVPRPEVLHTLFKGTQRRQSRPGANVRDQPHDE